MITLAELQVAYNDLLSWLATLTLGEIWSKIYNPPTRQNIVPVSALLLAACAYRLPEWSKKWEAWRVSRRVVWFAWPLPEVNLCLFNSASEIANASTASKAGLDGQGPRQTEFVLPQRRSEPSSTQYEQDKI